MADDPNELKSKSQPVNEVAKKESIEDYLERNRGPQLLSDNERRHAESGQFPQEENKSEREISS